MSGSLIYWVHEGENRFKSLNLTVCCEDDTEDSANGLAEVRRKRLRRLIEEAKIQGSSLTYKDLKLILLTSTATLKRDFIYLRKMGITMPMKKSQDKVETQR